MIVIALLAVLVAVMYYFANSKEKMDEEVAKAEQMGEEAAKAEVDYGDSNQLARDSHADQSFGVDQRDPDYGGAYLDDNGVLIICTVNITDELQEFAARRYPYNTIQYRLVENSMIELMETMDTLDPLMAELNISSLELDERNNKINIYIKDMTDEKMNAIAERVSSKTIAFRQRMLDVVAT